MLQLIEGLTLAGKIAQGPIPVEETLKIMLQMAEGLEAAHETEVIHRDLKLAKGPRPAGFTWLLKPAGRASLRFYFWILYFKRVSIALKMPVQIEFLKETELL